MSLSILAGHDETRPVLFRQVERAKHIALKKPGPKVAAADVLHIRTVKVRRMQDVITAAELLVSAALPHDGNYAIVPKDELLMLTHTISEFKGIE